MVSQVCASSDEGSAAGAASRWGLGADGDAAVTMLGNELKRVFGGVIAVKDVTFRVARATCSD